MNIGAIQIQVWLTIIVAIAATAIAVLATVLKKRNDKLRKDLEELQTLHVDDLRRISQEPSNIAVPNPVSQPRTPEPPKPAIAALPAETVAAAAIAVSQEVQPSPAPEDAPAAVESAAAPEVSAPIERPALQDSEVRERNIAVRHAQERALEFASRQGRRRHPVAASPKPDETNPREALSDWLNKRAAARGSQKPVTAEQPAPVHPEPAPEVPIQEETKPGEQAAVEPAGAEWASEPERAPTDQTPAQVAAAEPQQTTVFIDETLWETILGRSSSEKQVEETPRFELIQGSLAGLPAGLQDEAVLRRLLESNKPFRGLAIALGVTLNDGRGVGRDLMPHIQQLVRSLLEDDDFACQTADNEFLILCPGKLAEEAQTRLRAISELLWDFQLRGVGNFSIHFSTGDAQVEYEPLRTATAAASARLQQTSRVRKMAAASAASRMSASAAS